jgi:4-diphosphocytidyl-2-C-methyl-D-erythritol kinase
VSAAAPRGALRLAAPAKLNLRLVILAREAAGFHQLETLFCAVDLADDVEVATAAADDGAEDDAGAGDAGAIALVVDGADLGPPERNLAWRAAAAFRAAARLDPALRIRIRLRKRIPAGAGLGGGSSDAAAVLRALDRLHPGALAPARLLGLAAGLGSDVPFFLSGAPYALAWGRGERLLPLTPPPAAPVLLALPPFPSATPAAYRALAGARAAAAGDVGDAAAVTAVALPPAAELGRWERIAALAVNDFEPVLFPAYPLLRRLRQALGESGARLALLSGSGSAVFGIFDDDERRARAADRLASRFPTVHWTAATTLAAVPEPVSPDVDPGPPVR